MASVRDRFSALSPHSYRILGRFLIIPVQAATLIIKPL